jgi:hypothetical protein
MTRPKLILATLFTLTLAAGLVGGMAISRLPSNRATRANPPQTALASQLGLTREQNEKMHDIWQEVRNRVDACFVRAQELQKRRDDRLLALLSEEQKARFAPVQKEYNDALGALKEERDALFQAAVKQTEQLLTESQRERYRQILHNRLGDESVNDSPDWIAAPTSKPVLKG